MSGWEDTIREHPVHQVLDDAVDLTRRIDASTEQADALRHVEEVLEYVRNRLRVADAALLSPSLLATLQNRTNEVVTPLGQFEQSGNQAYLDQTAAPTDALLGALAAVPPPPADKLAAEAADRAKELRRIAGEGAKEIRGRVHELRKELDEAKNEMSAAANDAEGIVQRANQQVAQLEETIEQQSGRLDTALTDFSTRTQSALEELQSTFQTAETARLEEARTKAAEQLEELTTAGTEARSSFQESGRQVLGELEQLQQQAAKLVGTITSTATAGYFKKVADAEKKSADRWRIVTVVTAAVVGLIGLWAVLAVRDAGTADWSQLASKAFLSGPFAAIAGYAGKQSGSHRRAERDARHRELQLAALEPFLEPLGDDHKASVRAAFAEHLFGPTGGQAPSDAADAISTTDLVQALVSAVVQQNGAKR